MLRTLKLLCLPVLLFACVQTMHAQGSWCEGNVVANGDFATGLSPWNKGLYSVDYNSGSGCGDDAGFINMWGNLVGGEWLFQTLPAGGELKGGKTYEITFCQRFSPQPGRPYPVRFRIVATNDGTDPYAATTIALSDLTFSTTWESATFQGNSAATFQCPPGQDLSIIMIHAENESTATGTGSGDSTSTGQLDLVCIREVEPCQCAGTITPYKSTGFDCNCYYRFQLISPTATDSIVLRPMTPGAVLDCGDILDLPPGWVVEEGRRGELLFHTGAFGRPLDACDTAMVTFGVSTSMAISWASFLGGGFRPECSGIDSVTCCDCSISAYMKHYDIDGVFCNYAISITSPRPVDSVVVENLDNVQMGAYSQEKIPAGWEWDMLLHPYNSYSGPAASSCEEIVLLMTVREGGMFLVTSFFEGSVVCTEQLYLECDSCPTCNLTAEALPPEDACECGQRLRFSGTNLVGDIVVQNYDGANITAVNSPLISSFNWSVSGLGTPKVLLKAPAPYVENTILPCDDHYLDVCVDGSATITVETRYVHGIIDWTVCIDSVFFNCEPPQTGDCLLLDPCFDNVHGTLDPHAGNPITAANLPNWISLHETPDILPANSDWMGAQSPFCAEYYGGISSGLYYGGFITEALAGLMAQPTPAGGHWVNVHARFVKGETRPTPAVDLKIYLRNGSTPFTQGDAATYGLFVGSISVTEYDDWQLYTKDMFVGPGYDQLMFIGDEDTKHTLGYVFVDSVNVCLIDPPTSSPCDSIQVTGSLIDGECCKYRVTVINPTSKPVNLISYHLTGGTVDMVSAQPCSYTTQIITSSSGGLTFDGGCPGNMTFDIAVTADNNPGQLVLQFTLSIDGERCVTQLPFECVKDSIEPCLCCDIVETDPIQFPGFDLSAVQFQVHNTKDPASPITHIEIVPDPAMSGCDLQGGGLEVDAITQSWGYDYLRAPLSGSFPTPTAGTNALITFNLGINHTCGWAGTVTLVIYHADGESCTYVFDGWDNDNPQIADEVKEHGLEPYVISKKLTITPDSSGIVKLLLWLENPDDVVIGGSGEYLGGVGLDRGYAVLKDYKQSKNMAIFEFMEPLEAGTPSGYFNFTVRSTSTNCPVKYVFYHMGLCSPVTTGSFDMTTTSSIPPSGMPTPGDFELLPYFPDPANDNATFSFLIGTHQYVQLDIYTLLGEHVATVFSGDREAGLQSVRFNTSRLASGNYYLRLSSGDRQTTQQLRITH